jgi:hypothetical protein
MITQDLQRWALSAIPCSSSPKVLRWSGVVQVVAGSRTEVEVLQSFLAGFDGSLGQKTGIVTQEKFLSYYSSVSAAVDDDAYFELILRNTWHLPGAGDTTCRRLLVTKEDGTQSIEEIEDDIDISKEDLQVLNRRSFQGCPHSCWRCRCVASYQKRGKPACFTCTVHAGNQSKTSRAGRACDEGGSVWVRGVRGNQHFVFFHVPKEAECIRKRLSSHYCGT